MTVDAIEILPKGWTQQEVDYAMTSLIPCLVDLKRKARARMAAKAAADQRIN
jgi:uncharacterized protein (DUF2342 family)